MKKENKNYLLEFYVKPNLKKETKDILLHKYYVNKINIIELINNYISHRDITIKIYNNKCYNYELYYIKINQYRNYKNEPIKYINVFNSENNNLLYTYILINKYCYNYRLYNRKKLVVKIKGGIEKITLYNNFEKVVF